MEAASGRSCGDIVHPRRCGVALTAASGTLPPRRQTAANRFAAVGGTGGEPCLETNPCSIEVAINAADGGNDDDITLLGGVPPAAPVCHLDPPVDSDRRHRARRRRRRLPSATDIGRNDRPRHGDRAPDRRARLRGPAAHERRCPRHRRRRAAASNDHDGRLRSQLADARRGQQHVHRDGHRHGGKPDNPDSERRLHYEWRRHLQWRWFLHANPGDPGQASCPVTYTPTALGSGSHQITAGYGGDLTHEPSQGSTVVSVLTPPAITPPATAAALAAAIKKCKKKFRKGAEAQEVHQARQAARRRLTARPR